MKKLIALTIAVVLSVMFINNKKVERVENLDVSSAEGLVLKEAFPDDSFRSWMIRNIKYCNDGVLTDEEIEHIIGIEVSCDDIEGIQYLTSLKTLIWRNGKRKSVDLSSLTNLINLNIISDQFEEINLDGCPNLKVVHLSGKFSSYPTIKELDFSKLASLNVLTVRNMQLESIKFPEDTRNLDYLAITNTTLEQLTLPEMNLGTLDISRNYWLAYLDTKAVTAKRTILEQNNVPIY